MTATVYELIGFAVVRMAAEARELADASRHAADQFESAGRPVPEWDLLDLGKRRIKIDSAQRAIQGIAEALNELYGGNVMAGESIDRWTYELRHEARRWAGAPGWRKEWEL